MVAVLVPSTQYLKLVHTSFKRINKKKMLVTFILPKLIIQIKSCNGRMGLGLMIN